MKKVVVFMLALCLMTILAACGGASGDEIRAVRNVSFEGTELTVTLGTNKSTGYEWDYEIYGACIEPSVNRSFKITGSQGDATGEVRIGFEGTDEGSAVILFTTPNGWDGTGEGDAYTVEVEVGADGTIVRANGTEGANAPEQTPEPASEPTPESVLTSPVAADAPTVIGSIAENGYCIEIPAGAVESNRSFSAALHSQSLTHDAQRAEGGNTVYDFSFDPQDGISRFYEPVTITLSVPEELWEETNPWDLRVACYNGADWDYLEPAKIDTVSHTLSLQTYHCSLWGKAKPTTGELMREVAAEQARAVYSGNYNDDMQKALNEAIDRFLGEEADSSLKQDILDACINNMTVATDALDTSEFGSQNMGDYAQLVVAAKNGNGEGVAQNMAAILGRAFVKVSTSEKWAGFGAGTWDNLDLFVGTGKGAALLMNGDSEQAAQEFAKAIMSTNVVTKLGMTGVEIIQDEAARWKEAEIEKAYQIYLNGNDPSRWSLFGYGQIDKGDFDEIWNEMRGIGRHLLADAEAAYIKEHGSITETARAELERQVREKLRAEFENREKSEALVDKAVKTNMKLLEEMQRAEFFTSFYGYDRAKQSMKERMNELMAMKDAILADTGLTLGYVNSDETMSVEMLMELMMPLCIGDKQMYLDSLAEMGWKSRDYPLTGNTNGYDPEKDTEVIDKDLLINGDAEDGINGWSGDGWSAVTSSDGVVSPKEGGHFFWHTSPCEYAAMSQTVDISQYAPGATLMLSGYLCNWDQSPHDMATLKLTLLDAGGNELCSDQRSQRNPSWKSKSLQMGVPEGAVKARVSLIATRFVGNDIDGYFDDISLTVTGMKIGGASLHCDIAEAKAGVGVKLQVRNGQAENYMWSSSYDESAIVDSQGRVTFKTDDEVTIYAVNKQTGEELAYTFTEKKE